MRWTDCRSSLSGSESSSQPVANNNFSRHVDCEPMDPNTQPMDPNTQPMDPNAQQLMDPDAQPTDLNARREKRHKNAIAWLNTTIDAMNLGKEVSTVAPAKAVFGTVIAILTMIKVGLFPYCLR
jgi:hypothetical protein